ncbi:hypothetical protein [Leifsonia shinshuensis]|uniref:Uncharacterized protein n=1 Tax=Leifsonia shinshuensis TaxID=150026 RepID=A0A853CR31_9MICO|nr:hypothetical protein [Leifsonia shinshuensis]NYJ22373.1 hypothetical protein [Leifsonia shinshuensis]
MIDPLDARVVLLDGPTAATLAQILPLLLLTLMVELRRVEVHRRGRVRVTRTLLGLFFLVFGIVETVLVMSIDGTFIPFEWTDLALALLIFGLLSLLFWLSLLDAPGPKKRARDDSRAERPRS